MQEVPNPNARGQVRGPSPRHDEYRGRHLTDPSPAISTRTLFHIDIIIIMRYVTLLRKSLLQPRLVWSVRHTVFQLPIPLPVHHLNPPLHFGSVC